MGHVLEKIVGDVTSDPAYKGLTIEVNADGMVHIHHGSIRIDLTRKAYEEFQKGCFVAYVKIKDRHK